ncbi:hypothetical protein [Paenibacillus silviterrae]|uniref:hypothetical protein n=1 Tax=Paenibacillus silviterrae TaxID=3242194 RepID=UPI002542C507|nr:hypothetical protein [Paenibacillus chinjuensis]
MKKKVAKVGKRAARTVRLGANRVRATQNLGNGFRRHVLSNVTIAANQIIRIELQAPSDRRVISGGWTITQLTNAYATDSYPETPSLWVLYISNPTNTTRTITPYLITKRR